MIKLIRYGTTLTEQNEIEEFLKSIGTMKCKCMIVFKTLWEENDWLVYGYKHKFITIYDTTYEFAIVYDGNYTKGIKVPINDIECLEIQEICHINIDIEERNDNK